MKRREVDRILRSAGFKVEETKSHYVYRLNDHSIPVHRGDKIPPWLATQVKQTLRRIEQEKRRTPTVRRKAAANTKEAAMPASLSIVPDPPSTTTEPAAPPLAPTPAPPSTQESDVWSEADDLAIIDGVYKNLSDKEIADSIGRTERQVTDRRKTALDIRRKPGRKKVAKEEPVQTIAPAASSKQSAPIDPPPAKPKYEPGPETALVPPLKPSTDSDKNVGVRLSFPSGRKLDTIVPREVADRVMAILFYGE